MTDEITREPDGSGYRYFFRGRPWTFDRCALCREFGRYEDTECCEECEVAVLGRVEGIRAARGGG